MNLDNIREMFLKGILSEAEPVKGLDGRYHGVYVITNEVNGKFYIGKHTFNTKTPKDRYPGSGVAIRNAKVKYGEENFTMKYIHFSECVVSVDDHEDMVIGLILDEICNGSWAELKKICYNRRRNRGANAISEETRQKMIESGSGENNGFYGRTHSEETKQKISESTSGEKSYWYGKSLSEETRQKISDNHARLSGVNNPNYGVKFSAERRRQMSEAQSGEKSAWWGKNHSEETKQKMSENSPWKGKTLPEETKRLMRENHADYSGNNHPQFKGYSIGYNENKIVIFCGASDMRNRRFSPGAISAIILKRATPKSHKGYVFIRTDSPSDVIPLLEGREFADDETRVHWEYFQANYA